MKKIFGMKVVKPQKTPPPPEFCELCGLTGKIVEAKYVLAYSFGKTLKKRYLCEKHVYLKMEYVVRENLKHELFIIVRTPKNQPFIFR